MIESLVIALVFGLSGSTHCLGMCGGIAASLGGASSDGKSHLAWFYSSGRLVGYAGLGALAGALGALATPSQEAMIWLRSVAALFVVMMGIYILGRRGVLAWLEKLGGRFIWKPLSPLVSKVLPIDSIGKAMSAGLLWGLLPCGLVYSALAWSVAAGGALEGGLIMAAFALGTFPAMIGVSYLPKIAELLKSPKVRVILGVLIIGYGTYTLFQLQSRLWMDSEDTHHQHHQHHHHH